MVIGGMTRMGFIVNFFARPILIGFLNGIALSIIAGQLGKLLGIAVVNRDFGPSLMELAERLGEIHVFSLVVGLATLALLIMLRRHGTARAVGTGRLAGRRSGGVPVGTGAAAGQTGRRGALRSAGLCLPGLGYAGLQSIFMDAVGLVIVSFTSGMLTARSFAARNGYAIDADQEMRAIGYANMASGLFGGFAVTGADSRTAVNDASGGKTQLVSVIAALATAGVALFLAVPLGHLPIAALAAVLIFSAWGLLDIAGIRHLRAIDRFEFSFVAADHGRRARYRRAARRGDRHRAGLLQVLVKIYRPGETLLGIVPGEEGYNDLNLSEDARPVPGMIIYRFDAPLLFFNADYFKAADTVAGGRHHAPAALVRPQRRVHQSARQYRRAGRRRSDRRIAGARGATGHCPAEAVHAQVRTGDGNGREDRYGQHLLIRSCCGRGDPEPRRLRPRLQVRIPKPRRSDFPPGLPGRDRRLVTRPAARADECSPRSCRGPRVLETTAWTGSACCSVRWLF